MKKIIYTLIGILALTSCGNDWLGKAEPHTGTVAPGVIFADEMSINNAIVGTIDYMKEYYYDRHVTYGYRFYFLGLDFMGNDIISNPGQWWTFESQWNKTISSATGYQSGYYWTMFYKIINDVNSKIAGIETSTVSEAFKKNAIAELKAIRGYTYFNLARVFQFSYAYAGESAPCVPLYITPTTTESKGNDRATMKEVFTQILNDLNEAVNTLTASRKDVFRINKNIALAWRANVNLEMQKWADAASDANSARKGFSLMSKDVYQTTGFNTLKGNTEWMWGFRFQPDQAHGYASLFSHVDIYRPQNGYKNFFINETFVAQFKKTDMRYVFQSPATPEYAKTSWAKWGAKKFQDNAEVCGDYGMLRASEMYLVESEAMIRGGNVVGGHNLLYELQKHRDPSAVKSSNTGDALINEVLLERRKELYGEIGTEFFDLKRYNRPFSRNGNHAPSHLSVNIPAGNPLWLFQIPQNEFDRNPNIKEQNKR
ncbi:MAG: RagB/SusD family nutrient uptake outer membrane protein [Bacteroidales bacterium]